MKTYGERMKELRKENEKTQLEMGRILGCGQKTYSQYELRQRDTPTEILCKLASYYNVSTDYLLGRTDKRNSFPPPEE